MKLSRRGFLSSLPAAAAGVAAAALPGGVTAAPKRLRSVRHGIPAPQWRKIDLISSSTLVQNDDGSYENLTDVINETLQWERKS